MPPDPGHRGDLWISRRPQAFVLQTRTSPALGAAPPYAPRIMTPWTMCASSEGSSVKTGSKCGKSVQDSNPSSAIHAGRSAFSMRREGGWAAFCIPFRTRVRTCATSSTTATNARGNSVGRLDFLHVSRRRAGVSGLNWRPVSIPSSTRAAVQILSFISCFGGAGCSNP